MAIRAIVAVDPFLAIGRGGTLPWHYPADLRFFRETTEGDAVVMGRATWESLGKKPLPRRLNLVLSSRRILSDEGVIGLTSASELLALEQYLGVDLYVIGGAATYRELAPFVSEWIVTRIPEAVEDADTYLDSDLLSGFHCVQQRDLGDGLVVEYMRRR